MIQAGEALLGETMVTAQKYASSDVTPLGHVLIWGIVLLGIVLILTSRRKL